MVVKRCGAPVKAEGVPRVAMFETLVVEVMTELVTQTAQKRSERRDLLSDGGPHPYPNKIGFGIVVAEKSSVAHPPFMAVGGPGRKDRDPGCFDPVGTG